MTKEEKELLLKDLYARLYTDTMVNYNDTEGCDYKLTIRTLSNFSEEKLKCYLRPMSSMTEEERNKFENLEWRVDELEDNEPWAFNSSINSIMNGVNWLNSHHFDYRGLIEKGLALEAPKGMYNN